LLSQSTRTKIFANVREEELWTQELDLAQRSKNELDINVYFRIYFTKKFKTARRYELDSAQDCRVYYI